MINWIFTLRVHHRWSSHYHVLPMLLDWWAVFFLCLRWRLMWLADGGAFYSELWRAPVFPSPFAQQKTSVLEIHNAKICMKDFYFMKFESKKLFLRRCRILCCDLCARFAKGRSKWKSCWIGEVVVHTSNAFAQKIWNAKKYNESEHFKWKNVKIVKQYPW